MYLSSFDDIFTFFILLEDSFMRNLGCVEESLRYSKMSLEYIIDGSHDESDYRSRRIEYSSLHTQ